MATPIELEDRGELVKLNPDLDADELENRCIYVLPRVIAQIEKLAEFEPVKAPTEPHLEQLYEFLAHFAGGGELDMPRQFHDLDHRVEGVWELKTADIRLVGWFHRRDCFICTAVRDASFVKGTRPGSLSSGPLYYGLCEEAVAARDRIDLDPPIFIAGEHPENVVSNYTRSQP